MSSVRGLSPIDDWSWGLTPAVAYKFGMGDLSDELSRRVAGIAENRESGAADLVDQALDILKTARAGGLALDDFARRIPKAQPSMAPLWNAAIAALASPRDPERLDRFASRVAKSAEALARFAAGVFEDRDASRPLHMVTISASRSVQTALDAIRQGGPITVSCAEGRPGLEGRRLATHLASTRTPVTLYLDVALAQALGDADAVLVGADAVGPAAFLNKSGTRMLAAAAAQQGVPVYVVATRDKFVAPDVWAHLSIGEKPASEVWDEAPAGVLVRNAYFEPTSLDLVSAVISDAGVLGIGMVPQLCEALADPIAVEAFDRLIGSPGERR
jgi:translation initiation factor 2B subunit (eIF-2B alpha/beta/delta family)